MIFIDEILNTTKCHKVSCLYHDKNLGIFKDNHMTRFANFCAGPAMPTAVLERAQAEMLDWQGLGTSVMEISHRSTDYIEMAQSRGKFTQAHGISDEYAVLFLQGGNATLFSNSAKSDEWWRRIILRQVHGQTKLYKEAKRYEALSWSSQFMAAGSQTQFSDIPDPSTW